MSHDLSRRSFFGRAAAGAVAGSSLLGAKKWSGGRSSGPVVIASANGLRTVEVARQRILEGEDALDAAVRGVNLVEEDPNDTSVGYGGLPNEEGVVELDSCVMHGPTHNAGSVASLRNIVNPSLVALKVMRETDHVMLVGEGALKFARAHGFEEKNLLTEKARKIWLYWKATLSKRDDWFPPPDAAQDPDLKRFVRDWGTIHCSAVDANGDLGGVTTTSGLSFKIPGRIGDSPIIGAGCYTDNEVGSAGATGRGESVILSTGSAMIVERMREGLEPEQACLEVLKRIARQSVRNGLANADGVPNFGVTLYAVRKDGVFGGANMKGKARMAVADSEGARRVEIPGLY